VPAGRWPDVLVRRGQIGWLGLASPRKPAGHGEDLGGATGDKTGKQDRGRLHLDPSGRLWHGRYPLALQAVSFEADQAAVVLPDPGVVVVVVVVPIVALHGAQVPWGKVVVDGVPVVSARRLPSMLRQLPAVLGPERDAAVASQARIRFRAVA
jgi:hypothetical protein